MARSIWKRKRDLSYLVFFVIHIPVMLLVDLTPLYPARLHAALPFLGTLRSWYVATYADRLFVAPPAWFALYVWMEAVYHLPLSIWAIGALARDDPLVPLHLLVWAVQTGVTTATCIAEYSGWEGFSGAQRLALGQLYLPYCALAVLMGLDMAGRLRTRRITSRPSEDGRAKKAI